jgi:CheY-like chemotaxis protein
MSDHVKFISDGKEALNFLTAPDPLPVAQELVAIFLDLNLPSLSGLDLLRALRECERFQATPLNVTNYVSKPVTFISFSKAVADVFHLPRNPAPAPSEG